LENVLSQQKRQFCGVASRYRVPTCLCPALEGPLGIDGALIGLFIEEYALPHAFLFPDLDSFFRKNERPSIERRARRLTSSQGYELVPWDFAGLEERQVLQVKD